MKINKSVEQGVYVLLMMALQKDHAPVKSHVLSQILGVSDSYLKKILMKLAKAQLVVSSANKHGGYRLARPITDVSLADVLMALDDDKAITFKHLSQAIFDDKQHVKEGEDKILKALEAGQAAFYQEASKLKLSELLHEYVYESGVFDWEKRLDEAD